MASFLDNSNVPWWADAARHVPKSVMFGAMGGPLGALAGTAASLVGDDTPESLASRHARGIKQRAAMRGMFKTPGQTLAMDAPGEYHPPSAGMPMPQQPLGPMVPPPMPQGPQGPPGAPPGGPGGSAPWWVQAVNGMSPGVSQGLRGPPSPQPQPQAPPGPPMSLSPPNPGPTAPPPSQGAGFNFFSPIGKGLDGAVNDSAALVKKFYQDTFGQ